MYDAHLKFTHSFGSFAMHDTFSKSNILYIYTFWKFFGHICSKLFKILHQFLIFDGNRSIYFNNLQQNPRSYPLVLSPVYTEVGNTALLQDQAATSDWTAPKS